jgi:hypothetical protein
MYIPDFWCGVIVGASVCLITLKIIIVIASKVIRKR